MSADYRVTAYRGRTGDVWEPAANGRWRVYGHLPAGDVYDTVEALEAGEGPLTAVDVDDVAALLAENADLRRKLWLTQNTTRGRCRWCDAVVDPNHPAAPKRPTPDGPAPLAEPQPHRMHCRLYVGPLEHRWERSGWNQTFGGYDQWCVCGGWFRQGGLAGHGDGSETAEPVCPNADQTWREPK